MKNIFSSLILVITLFSCTRPLVVAHVTPKERALTKKKGYGYPQHNLLSQFICFNKLCLNKAEWRNKQKKRRFKGFKKPGIPIRQHHPHDREIIAQNISKKNYASVPLNKIQTFKHVLFKTSSAQLLKNTLEELDQLAKALKENENWQIKILGHTDDTGDEDLNKKLSNARARSVANYLKEKGIEGKRLSYQGFGSSKPIADNQTEVGRQKNRRVEFVISESKPTH
ncbi:OmpA family protein [Fulvivirgaceae bacterium BMA10]|uniref:OmpA family protein n=1 Tax=Splendidivirga corallicola TaxID=3051826 RepID=A0ABT8KW20_9BACT|nr:OmpA family protein [Fulvivirgaceae bacterium BMA10]